MRCLSGTANHARTACSEWCCRRCAIGCRSMKWRTSGRSFRHYCAVSTTSIGGPRRRRSGNVTRSISFRAPMMPSRSIRSSSPRTPFRPYSCCCLTKSLPARSIMCATRYQRISGHCGRPARNSLEDGDVGNRPEFAASRTHGKRTVPPPLRMPVLRLSHATLQSSAAAHE